MPSTVADRGALSENVKIDDDADIATIYGVRVAGEVLRCFTEVTPAGKWFRVVNTRDGVSVIETRRAAEFFATDDALEAAAKECEAFGGRLAAGGDSETRSLIVQGLAHAAERIRALRRDSSPVQGNGE